MQDLIAAIKELLQTDLDYVRSADVFVTEDDSLIPDAVKFPAIGIKDGPISRTEDAGGYWTEVLDIRVIVFVQLQKTEAAVMGDEAAGKKGVLEMADDIHDSLDNNLLGISGMQAAFSPQESESEFIGDESLVLQRKIITYRYEKQELRPSAA